jgi:hypothetical protein
MTTFPILFALGLSVSVCAAEPADRQTNNTAKALPPSWIDDKTEVTCKPAYYRRASDGLLVPVEEARRTDNLRVSGVVLSVVGPDRFANQVVAFHFDFPEQWDHWYKPDLLYSGVIPTYYIGRLLFMCDDGSLRNGLSPSPNRQGGANGRQPVQSETNRKPAAAAPRRSP